MDTQDKTPAERLQDLKVQLAKYLARKKKLLANIVKAKKREAGAEIDFLKRRFNFEVRALTKDLEKLEFSISSCTSGIAVIENAMALEANTKVVTNHRGEQEHTLIHNPFGALAGLKLG